MAIKLVPSGKEQFFGDDEIIVSKTDTHGGITYVNDIFLKVSGFMESEVLGQPHSMIRHPDMPRAVFKLLWDYLTSGREIFAYIMNLCKNGDHYWVFAHVTPTIGANGQIIGFHSNRRTPERKSLSVVQEVYAALIKEESRHSDSRKGLEESYAVLAKVLGEARQPYEEFIWSVGE